MIMITKAKLQAMRAELETAMKKIGAKHGITLTTGNATYSDDAFKMKISGTANATDGSFVSQAEVDFKKFRGRFGLPENALRKSVKVGNEHFVITGLKPRSFKYPVLGKSAADGKSYKLPIAAVKLSLGIK